jgi:hypothetical protein
MHYIWRHAPSTTLANHIFLSCLAFTDIFIASTMPHEHFHEKKPLKFFASPLHDEIEETHHGSYHAHHHASVALKKLEDEKHETKHHHRSTEDNVVFGAEDDSLYDMPTFQRHAEATTAELFFDLCKPPCIWNQSTISKYLADGVFSQFSSPT